MSFLDRLFRRKSGLSCHQVAAVLQEYLDKELDAAEVPKVLEHLEQCRDCGLEAVDATRDPVGALEVYEPPTEWQAIGQG